MKFSTSVVEALRAVYMASSTGDLAAIERLISPDIGTTMIGTDPGEWWEGTAVLAAWRAQLHALGGQLTVTPGAAVGYEEGTVGWVADRPTFQFADGSSVTIRLTAVFHHDDGTWKVVASHASLGVSNETVVGIELPT